MSCDLGQRLSPPPSPVSIYIVGTIDAVLKDSVNEENQKELCQARGQEGQSSGRCRPWAGPCRKEASAQRRGLEGLRCQ